MTDELLLAANITFCSGVLGSWHMHMARSPATLQGNSVIFEAFGTHGSAFRIRVLACWPGHRNNVNMR